MRKVFVTFCLFALVVSHMCFFSSPNREETSNKDRRWDLLGFSDVRHLPVNNVGKMV